MTLKIHEKRGLLCFRVRVQPSARRNEIIGLSDGSLRIKVAAPAQDLRANRELLEFLADLLHLPMHRLVVLRGDRSRENPLAFRRSLQEACSSKPVCVGKAVG